MKTTRRHPDTGGSDTVVMKRDMSGMLKITERTEVAVRDGVKKTTFRQADESGQLSVKWVKTAQREKNENIELTKYLSSSGAVLSERRTRKSDSNNGESCSIEEVRVPGGIWKVVKETVSTVS
jgi:hypothetical protein